MIQKGKNARYNLYIDCLFVQVFRNMFINNQDGGACAGLLSHSSSVQKWQLLSYDAILDNNFNLWAAKSLGDTGEYRLNTL